MKRPCGEQCRHLSSPSVSSPGYIERKFSIRVHGCGLEQDGVGLRSSEKTFGMPSGNASHVEASLSIFLR